MSKEPNHPLAATGSTGFSISEVVFVGCLLAVFSFQVFWFSANASATFDEPLHFVAGYTSLQSNDYRVNPGHPPFFRKLAVFPVLFTSSEELPSSGTRNPAGEPDLDLSLLETYWHLLPSDDSLMWTYSYEFLYGPSAMERSEKRQEGVREVRDFLAISRVATLLFSLILALTIYFWSRSLFGSSQAAGISTGAYVFDPNVIAHSGLLTTDIPAACLIVGAMFCFWLLCHHFSTRMALLVALVFSLAVVTKFSAILLVPCLLICGLIRSLSPEPWSVAFAGRHFQATTKKGKLGLFFGVYLFCGITSILIVWSVYGFRYSAFADGSFTARVENESGSGESQVVLKNVPPMFPLADTLFEAEKILADLARKSASPQSEPVSNSDGQEAFRGWIAGVLNFASSNHLLPEAFLYGIAYEYRHSIVRPSYLWGEHSMTGFRSYFFWTYLLKTPLILILCFLLGLIGLFFLRGRPFWRVGVLLASAGVFVLALVFSNLNIGHRHFLPVLPFFGIVAGGVVVLLSKSRIMTLRRWGWLGVVVLMGICAQMVFRPPFSPQIVAPYYLSYFNELAGGPLQGFRALSNSNLDWWQGKIALRNWLRKKDRKGPVYVTTYGISPPSSYGLQTKFFPAFLGGFPYEAPENQLDPQDQLEIFQANLKPGDLFAVSSEFLVHREIGPFWKDFLQQCRFEGVAGFTYFLFSYVGPAQNKEELERRLSGFPTSVRTLISPRH